MKLNFAHFCDYAFITEKGTPSLIGIFSGIRAEKLPSEKRDIFAIIDISTEKEKKYKFSIVLSAPSGKKMNEREIDAESSNTGHIGFLGKIDNVIFQEEGKYEASIFCNNKKLDSFSFLVVKK